MFLSRRALLGGLGGLVAGGAVASFMGNMAHAADAKPASPTAPKRFAQIGGDFSWKPHKLDPKEVALVAHEGYHHQAYG